MIDDVIATLKSAQAMRDGGDHDAAVRAFNHALELTDTFETPQDAVRLTDGVALRAQVAREFATVLIDTGGDLGRISDLLDIERTALEAICGDEPTLGILARHYSEFVAGVAAADEPRAMQAATALHEALFGPAGPDAAFTARIALIRNLLVRAKLIADREGDLQDAMAVAEAALDDALGLARDHSLVGAGPRVREVIEEALDTIAEVSGHQPTWWGRAITVRSYLPDLPDPRAAKCLNRGRVALLFLGLGTNGSPEQVTRTT